MVNFKDASANIKAMMRAIPLIQKMKKPEKKISKML
jgi:hypothetical protein